MEWQLTMVSVDIPVSDDIPFSLLFLRFLVYVLVHGLRPSDFGVILCSSSSVYDTGLFTTLYPPTVLVDSSSISCQSYTCCVLYMCIVAL